MKVYLDNAATTKLDKRVLEAMMPFLKEKYGNASSIHSLGKEAREAVENARKKIAKKLNCKAEEVVFTSGGTEANNFTLKGIAIANRQKGKHIIVSKIEHPCILETAKFLAKEGFDVSYLNVNKEGIVKLEELEEIIRKDTILVSIMHANNEIGTIQPIKEVAKLCKEKGIYFHTDACQSFTKEELNMKKFGVDLVTINAHKIHGPKGVGALVIKENVKIEPLLHGGGHELGKRSGTYNVPSIVGFGKAVEIANDAENERIRKLRDLLIERVLDEIEDVKLNGSREKRLCNNANFAFAHIESESLLFRLDSKGVYCSAASACASERLKASHVLIAIGLSDEYIHGSLRMTLGRYNTKEEIEYAVECLKQEVSALRKISKVLGCMGKK